MRENQFRKAMCDRLMLVYGPKFYVMKSHGSQFGAGLPDLTVLLDGCVAFLELKYTPEPTWDPRSVTQLQLYTLGRIHRAGGIAQVVVWWDEPRVMMALTWQGLQWAMACERRLTLAELALQEQWCKVLTWPERGGGQEIAKCLSLL